MDEQEHKERHIQLHKYLDELFADYISAHPDKKNFYNMPLSELISWSYNQTQNLDHGN